LTAKHNQTEQANSPNNSYAIVEKLIRFRLDFITQNKEIVDMLVLQNQEYKDTIKNNPKTNTQDMLR
jgi:hypothetical protein